MHITFTSHVYIPASDLTSDPGDMQWLSIRLTIFICPFNNAKDRAVSPYLLLATTSTPGFSEIFRGKICMMLKILML